MSEPSSADHPNSQAARDRAAERLVIEGMLADIDEGDAHGLAAWLAGAGVDIEGVRSLPSWHAASSPAILPAAIAAAARRPYGVALLLVYLLVECESTWEESYHYGPIWAALRDGTRWREHAGPMGAEDELAAEAVSALLRLTDAEIQVENAMTSGRILGFGDLSHQLVLDAERAAVAASHVTADCPPLAAFVHGRAASAQRYYRAATTAGHAVHRFLSEPGGSLAEAIAELAAAESADDLEATRVSELRAHRFALLALADDARRPWLHVDSGKIVYIYPFALPESSRLLADRVADSAVEWRLAGVTPRAVHPSFTINDIWDGTDVFGRTYSGTQVVLPDVTMRHSDDPASGEAAASLSAELRLSRIGNHYVRLEMPLVDAGPHELYTAMFRAAPEHGSVQVTIGDGPDQWPRLSDLAQRIASDVAISLGADAVWSDPADGSASDREESLARRGPYHVLVVVQAASVSDGPAGARREIRTQEELIGAVGAQVLANPVTHCVSALAEWSRYPTAADWAVAGTATHRDDVVLRTANTTVLAALGAPEFHIHTREILAEFVGSLDGLFAGWSADLTNHYRAVEKLLATTEIDQAATSDALRHVGAALRSRQQRLVEFVADVRSTVALIESPGLVASPVVSAMKAGLLEAAGFQDRARELDRQVEQVLGNRLDARIDESVRDLAHRAAHEEEARQQRQRARLDTALAVIAAVGISGLGQIIQAGYDVRSMGAVWISGAIVVLALLFGVAVRLASRTDRRSHASTGPAAVGAPDDAAPRQGTYDRSQPAPNGRPGASAGPPPAPRRGADADTASTAQR